jgi:hypothetical protein
MNFYGLFVGERQAIVVHIGFLYTWLLGFYILRNERTIN